MAREIPLSHPGIILLEDWLMPMGISQYALAKAIDVPPRRINEIVKGLHGITVDTALRLGAYFGTDTQSWINLQTHFDTELAREAMFGKARKSASIETMNRTIARRIASPR
jgi:addiction module HigA family antidote